jgi:trehalose 6-phosphate phosphatase
MGLPADLLAALDVVSRVPVLLVTSDFDGTLAPIVSHPADARPLPDAAAALVALSRLPQTSSALISGRALVDLRTLSGMPEQVHLVGSHGSEFAAGFLIPLDDAARALLTEVSQTLTDIAADAPGATVEIKPASVALHVRNAEPTQAAVALDCARAAMASWDVHATEGKSVLELAVIKTDKGQAIDILRQQEQASAVVFLGDDVTDEKAFARLSETDLGVKVGEGETLARYRISTPEDVATTLTVLLEARTEFLAD